jgi:hypothetical protein
LLARKRLNDHKVDFCAMLALVDAAVAPTAVLAASNSASVSASATVTDCFATHPRNKENQALFVSNQQQQREEEEEEEQEEKEEDKKEDKRVRREYDRSRDPQAAQLSELPRMGDLETELLSILHGTQTHQPNLQSVDGSAGSGGNDGSDDGGAGSGAGSGRGVIIVSPEKSHPSSKAVLVKDGSADEHARAHLSAGETRSQVNAFVIQQPQQQQPQPQQQQQQQQQEGENNKGETLGEEEKKGEKETEKEKETKKKERANRMSLAPPSPHPRGPKARPSEPSAVPLLDPQPHISSLATAAFRGAAAGVAAASATLGQGSGSAPPSPSIRLPTLNASHSDDDLRQVLSAIRGILPKASDLCVSIPVGFSRATRARSSTSTSTDVVDNDVDNDDDDDDDIDNEDCEAHGNEKKIVLGPGEGGHVGRGMAAVGVDVDEDIYGKSESDDRQETDGQRQSQKQRERSVDREQSVPVVPSQPAGPPRSANQSFRRPVSLAH